MQAEIRRLAADERCVAVGECGLDFNRDFSPRSVQEACFEDQAGAHPEFLHSSCLWVWTWLRQS